MLRAPGGDAPSRQRRQRARQPEIGDLDAARLVHPDGRRVEPAVRHRAGRALEPVGDVGDQVAGAAERDGPALAALAVDELAQRLAVEQLGRDVEEIGLAPDGQDLDQVLVDQRAGVLDVGLELRRRSAQHAHRDDAHGRRVPVADVGGAVGLTDRVLRQQSVDTKAAADGRTGGNLPRRTRYGERFTYRGHAELPTLTNFARKPKHVAPCWVARVRRRGGRPLDFGSLFCLRPPAGSFLAWSIQSASCGSVGSFSVIFAVLFAFVTAVSSLGASCLTRSAVLLTPAASSSSTISLPTPLIRSRSQRFASASRSAAGSPEAFASAFRSFALAALPSRSSVVPTLAFFSFSTSAGLTSRGTSASA